jgi:hypothetical protein
MSDERVLVIVPTYNEKENLPLIVGNTSVNWGELSNVTSLDSSHCGHSDYYYCWNMRNDNSITHTHNMDIRAYEDTILSQARTISSLSITSHAEVLIQE